MSGLNIFVVRCTDGRLPAQARVARSARALKVGTLRPAIVLYDEPHPLGDEIGQIQAADSRKRPDLMIIMGTSLKVHGLKKLVREFAKVTHARKGPKTPGIVIFVNKTPPGSEWDGVIDYHVEGDADSWTDKVLADWKKHKPADWEHQTTLAEGLSPFRISNGFNIGGRCLFESLITLLNISVRHKKPQGERRPETSDRNVRSYANATFLAVETTGVDVSLLRSRVQSIKTSGCGGIGVSDRRGEKTVVHF